MRDDELPNGWTTACIADLTACVTSGSRGWAEHYARNGAVFFRVGNLDRDTLVLDLEDVAYVQPPEGAEGERTRTRPGDVLLSITADVGMVGVVPPTLANSYVSQHLALVRPAPGIDSVAFAYSLLDPTGLQKAAKSAQYGVTKPSLSLAQVRGFTVPVPPLPEQHRIVAALDTYLSRLDAAVASLERARRNLGRYRASVLQAAVEGRLVPTEASLARAEGRDFEPADALLARVLVERKQRWLASGKRGKYEEPVAPDVTGLPELPAGWCWASPSQFFAWSSGRFLPKKLQQAGPIPVYGGNGVAGFHNDASVHEPVLVIGRVGAQCGNVLATSGPAWVTDNAIIGRPQPITTSLAFWRFALLKANLNANAAGTGQPYVNQPLLDATTVALPPVAEQTRIVAEVDRLLSVAATTEATVTTQLARVQRLRQAVLKWAFEGKLVDQDPNDEPASVLLERIRAERANSEAPGKRRGRGRQVANG